MAVVVLSAFLALDTYAGPIAFLKRRVTRLIALVAATTADTHTIIADAIEAILEADFSHVDAAANA